MLDIAIIGFPKSGTSSLFYWLDAHPGVQGSRPKETFFLMDPEHPLAGRHGLSLMVDGRHAFEAFFEEPANGRLRLEATTHSYYQDVARKFMVGMAPQPVIVAVVRQPADRIRSSFLFTQENLAAIDRRLSFAKYVDALLDGGVERIEKYYNAPSSYWIAQRELKLSQYVEWLDLWADAIGRDRLVLIRFEDLKERPGDVIGGLCDRLGLESGQFETRAFEARNRTARVRSQIAHRLGRYLAPGLPDGLFKNYLRRLYATIQIDDAPSVVDMEDILALGRLDDYFEPFNARLGQTFGLDVALWSESRVRAYE